MVKVLIVNKTGEIKESLLKSSDRKELYKKAGFKKDNGFEQRAVWSESVSGKKIEIELWSKDEGKAGSENKYDFPPPIDTELYFGSCILIQRNPNNHTLEDLTLDTWSKLYEKLFGGFEDLDGNESEASEDELSSVPNTLKTRDGYLKDGFICDAQDDIESDDDLEDDESEDGEDNIIIDTSNRSRKIVKRGNSDRGCDSSVDDSGDELWNNGYDSSELVAEPYIYSDED